MPKSKLVQTRSGLVLVRLLAAEGLRIFTTDDARALAPDAGVSEGYLKVALHYLTKSGQLFRLRKGLYALSTSVSGVNPLHKFEIAMALVRPAAISHGSALHYHGLKNAFPRKVFVLTASGTSVPRVRIPSSMRKENDYPVAGTSYKFVRVKQEHFFGTERVRVGNAGVTITNLERTLLDGLSMPHYCGDFGDVLNAFRSKLVELNLDRMIEYGLRWNVAMTKRLGWVLDRCGVEIDRLEPLLYVPVKGYRKLDPTGPRVGTCNTRWMIQDNRSKR